MQVVVFLLLNFKTFFSIKLKKKIMQIHNTIKSGKYYFRSSCKGIKIRKSCYDI